MSKKCNIFAADLCKYIKNNKKESRHYGTYYTDVRSSESHGIKSKFTRLLQRAGIVSQSGKLSPLYQ